MKRSALATALLAITGFASAGNTFEYEVRVTKTDGAVTKTVHELGIGTALGTPFPFSVMSKTPYGTGPRKRANRKAKGSPQSGFAGVLQPTRINADATVVETAVKVSLFDPDGLRAEMVGGQPVEFATSSDELTQSGIDEAIIVGGRRYILRKNGEPAVVARGSDGYEITISLK